MSRLSDFPTVHGLISTPSAVLSAHALLHCNISGGATARATAPFRTTSPSQEGLLGSGRGGRRACGH
jgi:hypothetical protein